MTAILADAAPQSLHHSWIAALAEAARHYHLAIPRETIRQYSAQMGASAGDAGDHDVMQTAQRMGLTLEYRPPDAQFPEFNKLPLIAELDDGSVILLTSLNSDGDVLFQMPLLDPQGRAAPQNQMPMDQLFPRIRRFGAARPTRSAPDARVDAYIRPYQQHWLRRILMQDIRFYANVLIASLLANLLAFGSVVFSMQVYDRVVPAQSFPTLYILFSGVMLALFFEFMLRRLRMTIIDVLGKRADLIMSDRVFGRALRIRSEARPKSTGTFISQLRDMEQVREMLTSTTVAAIADLPFFLLFLLLFWVIAGWLVLVPLGALILLVLPGVLMQRRLHGYASEGMRESSLRNAMLVEAVQRIDDIKMLQAEAKFEQQWNMTNETTSQVSLKLRQLTNILTVWTQTVQTGTFTVIILFGAPMVMKADMTTGALVGASILGSRMLAPLAQLTQVFSRLQHAKVGINSLNSIMQLPVDSPDQEQRIALPILRGEYQLRGARYRYGDEMMPIALSVRHLHIRPGEKIALLGRNGAGKSTLLQALSGLITPVSGEALLDDLAMHQIDPADVRHGTGYLSQGSALFHGSIRDNLVMGAPRASDQDILAALSMVGADAFIRKLPNGLSYPVMEGGKGLSGGQIQALLLARMIIRQPNIVLLDEPTASMDDMAERQFIRHFQRWATNRTVVVATHRPRVLDMVDRIIMLQNGEIVMDDKKESALERMRGAMP
ncbi:type I secretion system permease/ATPase [Sphingopyxis yananensis]|uniref:type I secretion system permease/ATPase n=1 Tax=Sphingopyxis yananensis TaxID=2886687 RepID=UPI001D107345|nr:type I secretion system permease/ATPase [Sphingopyxis yananensis]MCC2602965.1 type I secretion system permease/ATPase [Sphingopyxis yananensis]